MLLNPNGAPAGFDYQAGVIDPAGTYSPAGASAPTNDPTGPDSGAGTSASTLAAASIPITGATSAAAVIVDAVGAYRGAGASAPTLAAAGVYIPITGATSAAAEIVDPAGSPAGASAPTTDPVRTRRLAGASAPTPAAAGASSSPHALDPLILGDGDETPLYSALSSNIEAPVANYGSGGAGKSAAPNLANLTLAQSTSPAVSNANVSLATSNATTINPQGAPPGYYYDAATNSYVKDPPGTYSTGGATVPIADPGGTYSAAGASAPTTDLAGTYSSPYALNRLVIVGSETTPANAVLSFQSITAVANYYGATSSRSLPGEGILCHQVCRRRDNAVHAFRPWAEAAFARGQHQH